MGYQITILLCKKGDNRWTELTFETQEVFKEEYTATAVFHRGECYWVVGDSRLGVFNPVKRTWKICGEAEEDCYAVHNSLVESNGELFRIRCFGLSRGCASLYKLNHRGYVWEKTRNIGRRCFFVGWSSSIKGYSVRTIKGEEGKVYFPIQDYTCDTKYVYYYAPEDQVIFPVQDNGSSTILMRSGSCWFEPNLEKPALEELQWLTMTSDI